MIDIDLTRLPPDADPLRSRDVSRLLADLADPCGDEDRHWEWAAVLADHTLALLGLPLPEQVNGEPLPQGAPTVALPWLPRGAGAIAREYMASCGLRAVEATPPARLTLLGGTPAERADRADTARLHRAVSVAGAEAMMAYGLTLADIRAMSQEAFDAFDAAVLDAATAPVDLGL